MSKHSIDETGYTKGPVSDGGMDSRKLGYEVVCIEANGVIRLFALPLGNKP